MGVYMGSIDEPADPRDFVKPLIDFPLLRWLKIKDTEKIDLNVQLGVSRLREILPDYLVAYYKANNIGTNQLMIRTEDEIGKDLNNIIKFAMSDLNALGYGFE